MRKITCGCGTTVRGDTDEAVVRLAERHIAIRHGAVGSAAGREDLRALAEDDLARPSRLRRGRSDCAGIAPASQRA